jgi:hypothetical protein
MSKYHEKPKSEVGLSHAHTKPIFETTTRTGAHVVVSQDVSSKRNPAMELATTAARGETLHNDQIGHVLERTAEALDRESHGSRLDTQGQRLARDTEDLLLATERLLLEKNKEEELQHLAKLPGVLPEREQASALYNNARTLVVELLRSGEFREISGDVLELFRDVLAERGMHTHQYMSRSVETSQVCFPVHERVVVEEREYPVGERRYPAEEKVIRSVYEVKNVGPQATEEPVVEHTVYKEQSVPTPVTSETRPTVVQAVPTTRTCEAPYQPVYTSEYLESLSGSRAAVPTFVTETESASFALTTVSTIG